MSKQATESKPSTAPVRPTIGRILHYRYRAEDGCEESVVGEYRPAQVVRVWKDEFGAGIDGYNLLVAVDGKNDFPHGLPHGGHTQLWVTSVRMGDGNGECCWPPPA